MDKSKRQLIVAAWIILASLVALTAATYAWMSIATSYRVSDLELNVITENAMEIALDVDGAPGEWLHEIAAESLIDPEATLRPVTWSAKDMAFYAPKYGLDGRVDFRDPRLITSVAADIPTPSAAEAEEGEGAGYLISVNLWLRTGAAKVTTYLSIPDGAETDDVQTGTYVVGVPVWNADKVLHTNGGNGAEAVLRIGFRTYDEEYEEGRFYIYEPNAGQEMTTDPNGDPLEGEGKLIQQAPSFWTEQDPVLHGAVDYHIGEIVSQDTTMFTLVANEPRLVTVYIWLEGQDAQCKNSISAGQILANLHFGATTNNGAGDIIRPEGGIDQDE